MACSSTDPAAMWIDQAERSLFALASELRRVPLGESTRQLHVRALELKREMVRWREHPPDQDVLTRALEEIERLAREARRHQTPVDRSRSAALAVVSRARLGA